MPGLLVFMVQFNCILSSLGYCGTFGICGGWIASGPSPAHTFNLSDHEQLTFRRPLLTPVGTPSVLALAADRLGNALRLYAETSLSFRKLFALDRDEAIDNLDRAFDAILAGFHSLYDAMTAQQLPLNWHAYGDTAACIIVRNARHHNAAGLFESWNSRMLKHGELGRMAGAAFLLVGYRLVAGEGRVSEYYVRWDDFRARLAMPKVDSRISDPPALAALFERDCAFAKIKDHATSARYPANQVYLNLIPIAINAATRVFSTLRGAGVTLTGFDSTTYADHFARKAIADLQTPVFKSIRAPGS
jgi:hypothetical protein